MSSVSLDDLKEHLNITTADDDAVLLDYLSSAEQYIDAFLLVHISEYLANNQPVPMPIQHAIKMLSAHFYENREAYFEGSTLREVPIGVFDIIALYRNWSF